MSKPPPPTNKEKPAHDKKEPSFSHSYEAQRFTYFYQRHRIYVQDLCGRRFHDANDIQDLMSLVWMEVRRHFKRFEVDDPRPRLYKLVQWRTGDIYGQRYGMPPHALRPPDVDKLSLLHLLEQRAGSSTATLRQALLQGINAESKLDLQLLVGRYLEGLGWLELAQRHQLPQAAVLHKVEETLTRLRRLVASESERQS